MSSSSPDQQCPEEAPIGCGRRGFLALGAAVIAELQTGCAATIIEKMLIGTAEPNTSAPKPAPTHSPEEMDKLEEACDVLVADAERKIAATDFVGIGELDKRIDAELTKFRSNPTQAQRDALALIYAEHDMKTANLRMGLDRLDEALRGYALAMHSSTPERARRIKEKTEQIEKIDIEVTRKFEMAHCIPLPPWKEIEKTPVKDQGYTLPPPPFTATPRRTPTEND